MGKHRLGELEEIVLLMVAILHGEAYGIAIANEIEHRLGHAISIGSMQTVLKRLEKKGYLTSTFGEATQIRGGKRKRYFTITRLGEIALSETKEERLSLWRAIPRIVFEN